MMMKEKSSKWACAKYLYVLPLAAVAVAAFARPEVSGVSNELSGVKVTDLAAMVQVPSEESVLQDTVKTDGKRWKGKVPGFVYGVVDQLPEFPGGPQAMMKFLKDNMRYPQEAKEKGIEGDVVLQFVITEEGEVYRQPKVLRSIDPLLDAEAIRIVEAMPAWTPGRKDGKVVAVKYTLSIRFRLESEAKSSASKDEPVVIHISE